MKCLIPTCDSDFHRANAPYSKHRFPKNQAKREAWVRAIEAADCNLTAESINFKWAQICSKHFAPNCIKKTKLKYTIKKDAVPTIFDCRCRDEKADAENAMENADSSPTKRKKIIKKTIRYVGDIRAEDLDGKELVQAFPKLQAQLLRYRKTVKALRHQNLQQSRRIIRLKALIPKVDPKKQNFSRIDVPKTIPIIEELNKRRRGDPYSEMVRNFASTLNMYSTRSYEYVWKMLGKTLPHPRTLARWQAEGNGQQSQKNAPPETTENMAIEYIESEVMIDEQELKGEPSPENVAIEYIESEHVLDETEQALIGISAGVEKIEYIVD